MLAEVYKHLLGRLLGWGLALNRFSFPEGFSPVPTPAQYRPLPRALCRPHQGSLRPDALQVLFEAFSRAEIHRYGNAATASGSMQYLMTHHFGGGVLDFDDARCPSIVACAAWK